MPACVTQSQRDVSWKIRRGSMIFWSTGTDSSTVVLGVLVEVSLNHLGTHTLAMTCTLSLASQPQLVMHVQPEWQRFERPSSSKTSDGSYR